MLRKLIVLMGIVFVLQLSSCIEKKDTVEERPRVEILSPRPCDTLRFGEVYEFQIRITDNTGLGNLSMDVHNNFGHHNHGGHQSCNMDAVKEAVRPYFESWIFSLPENEKEYTFKEMIKINDSLRFDQGDYHFHLYVTDNEGYQVFTTFDVKIQNRL